MTTTKFDCRAGGLPAAIETGPTEAVAVQPLNCIDFLPVSYYNIGRGREKRRSVKSRLSPPLIVVLLMLLTCSMISTCCATVITFDDLPNSTTGTFIASGYQSLNWTNFGVVNALLSSNVFGVSGYGYGMVSPSNVAYNGFGLPAEIDSRGTNFNFLSAYLTGAWNSNLNIEVQGFRSGSMLYDSTVVASATNSSLFTFNYLDIDRLYFNSFGGQNAGFASGLGEHFVMDNLTFEFVPEPSSFLLTTAAALMLWPLLKRKRA